MTNKTQTLAVTVTRVDKHDQRVLYGRMPCLRDMEGWMEKQDLWKGDLT